MPAPTCRPPHSRARTALAALLVLAAPALRADRLFVGILEMDSYQSAIFGVSAFSRIADLPIVQESISAELTRNLALPSFTGVSSQETLRIVQSADPARPLDAENPANVAIIPLADTGAALLGAYASAYRKRTPLSASTTLFENPSNTNLAPRVAVAISGRTALTSASREALAWAWQNRDRLIDSPAQTIPGTFRVLVNAQRLADLLGTRGTKSESFVNLDALLRDFETLSLGLSLDGQAAAFAVRGKPRAESSLSALAAALRCPSSGFWSALPDNAFFAALSSCTSNALWNPYLGETRTPLLEPAFGLLPQSALAGERLTYLAPTASRTGLCLVQLHPLTNAAAAAAVLDKLHTAAPSDGVSLKHGSSRQAAGTRIESYDFALQAPEGKDGQPAQPSTLFTLLSLFLKQAVYETAVASNCLLTVIGPAGSLESELPALAFREKPLPLNRKIAGQDPALTEHLSWGATLQLAALLRHVVSIMPGVKPEHLRVLPVGGDGASFGLSQDEDKTLTASLRIQTSELAALQRANRDGREVLQELFFQMFSAQLMNLKNASPAARGPNP